MAEHLGSIHGQLALGVRGADRLPVRPVGPEHDRPDHTALASARPQDDGAGRIGEQRRCPLVLVVGDPRDEVGSDQQDDLGSTAFDLRRAE